jgi:hypothetical protein
MICPKLPDAIYSLGPEDQSPKARIMQENAKPVAGGDR